MKVKVTELTGAALDWAVAKAWQPVYSNSALLVAVLQDEYCPSTEWAQGGQIIEREKIATEWSGLWMCWQARDLRHAGFSFSGPTLLIAAMRSYVAFKLGDEVNVPEELL